MPADDGPAQRVADLQQDVLQQSQFFSTGAGVHKDGGQARPGAGLKLPAALVSVIRLILLELGLGDGGKDILEDKLVKRRRGQLRVVEDD